LCGITMEEPGVSKLVAVNLRTRKASPSSQSDSSAEGAPGIGQVTAAS
jgi:hypothetical protein